MEIPSGNYLRAWRKEIGLTQLELSALCGISQSVIAKVEREDVDARASTLRKIITALKRHESPDGAHVVDDIMTSELYEIHQNTTLQDAIHTMVSQGVSQLPVIEQTEFLGAISEQDLINTSLPSTSLVREIMNRNPPTIEVGLGMGEVKRRFERNDALWVVDGHRLVGLVTRIDFIRTMIGEQHH